MHVKAPADADAVQAAQDAAQAAPAPKPLLRRLHSLHRSGPTAPVQARQPHSPPRQRRRVNCETLAMVTEELAKTFHLSHQSDGAFGQEKVEEVMEKTTYVIVLLAQTTCWH